MDARGVLADGGLREDRPDRDAHEDEDHRDLDHREPELSLTEGLHAHHVEDEHEASARSRGSSPPPGGVIGLMR